MRNTRDLGLTYTGKEEGAKMFVDASFASDKKDRKSMTGYVVKIFGDSVIWKSKKQSCVSISSAEAEYVALSVGAKELIALVDLVERTTGDLKQTPVVFEDNRSTICLAKSKEVGRLRHVDVSYHHVKWLVESGRIDLQWINSESQIADFLTKPLKRESFERCRAVCLGVK